MIYNELVHLCTTLIIFVRVRKISIKEKLDHCMHIFAGTPQGSIVKVLKAKGIDIIKQAVSK